MISVCHVISGDLWAGAEVMVYCLLKGLKKHDNLQLSVILLNEGKLADRIRNLNISVDVVDESKTNIIKIIKNMNDSIVKKAPNIMHSHRHKENILTYLSTRNIKQKITLLSTQHGIPEFYSNNQNIKHKLLHRLNFYVLSRYFRKVITVSEDINKLMNEKYKFPKYKLKTIYNGINTVVDSSIKKNNVLQEGLFVIGTTGRLFPVKDYALMVEIAREIYPIAENIRFEIAGDGPERENINALIRRYDLGKTFKLRGFIDDLSDFYNRLDLYLNTSFHEGIPMGALEAMSYALPIVAPNVGGFKEIIQDGIHGYIVDGRDPKVYAEKILHIYNDSKVRNDMGVSARERVINNFTVDHMATEYHNLYIETSAN